MFEYYLKKQIKIHPYTMCQDALKQCFQAAFGAEHLLMDIENAKKYLYEEFSMVEIDEKPIFEQISEKILRVNLSAWKKRGFEKELLFQMFVLTSSIEGSKKSKDEFFKNLQVVDKLAIKNTFLFSSAEWEKYKKDYLKNGIQAVHHSELYRKKAHPAYRIVSKDIFKSFL